MQDNAMQAQLQEPLSPTDAEVILGRFPERIGAAPIAHAVEVEYWLEAGVEMAALTRLRKQRWFNTVYIGCFPDSRRHNL